jgi:hypothetical protein
MSNYTIEGNINFHEELYKLLDEDSEDEDTLCQITGLPLKDRSVNLECNHHFNYNALYKEIYKQKFDFKTYNPQSLTKNDFKKFNESKVDYFIRCPYCRNIQFTILPYYEDLGLEQVYGINSLDKSLQPPQPTKQPYYGDKDYSFEKYGTTFKWGNCCKKVIKDSQDQVQWKCNRYYVAKIPGTELLYCNIHYKEALKNHKIAQKTLEIATKLAIKKEKEEKLNERKKLFEEMNAERVSKGLLPLKRMPVIKKKVENVVEQQNNTIQHYVPEEENGCNAVLKSGPNKGKLCGCKKIEANGLCKRHLPKDQVINDLTLDNKL